MMVAANPLRPLILICDDEVSLRELVKAALGEGYDFVEAEDAAAAGAAIAELGPAAVVLDVMLPGKSGLELLAELRARGNDVPVMVVSAWQSEEQAAAALGAGADAFIGKPFDPGELLAAIQELVAA